MDKDAFKAAYVRMGKTQTDVAREIGITQNALHDKMERGGGDFRQSELKKLYDYLNITTDEFMHIFFDVDCN